MLMGIHKQLPPFAAKTCSDICPRTLSAPTSEQSVQSRKPVSFEEQIISKDKYLRIFSRQMEAFVFIILQIFFTTRAFLKTGEYRLNIPQF